MMVSIALLECRHLDKAEAIRSSILCREQGNTHPDRSGFRSLKLVRNLCNHRLPWPRGLDPDSCFNDSMRKSKDTADAFIRLCYPFPKKAWTRDLEEKAIATPLLTAHAFDNDSRLQSKSVRPKHA